jgi:hypothetical protein
MLCALSDGCHYTPPLPIGLNPLRYLIGTPATRCRRTHDFPYEVQQFEGEKGQDHKGRPRERVQVQVFSQQDQLLRISSSDLGEASPFQIQSFRPGCISV